MHRKGRRQSVSKDHHAPSLRRCAVTRELHDKGAMIRFVVCPHSKTLVPDLKGTLPGRGLWVSAKRTLVACALKKRVFTRGFRQNVQVPVDLPDQIDTLLRERLLGRFGMARKSGKLILGFEKVVTSLRENKLLVFCHANDAGKDGLSKIMSLKMRKEKEGCMPPVFAFFTTQDMEGALGKENVTYIGALPGHMGQSLLNGCLFLKQFREG